MGRHCFFTTARDGKLKEYIHWHDNIFPEVCAGLRAAGITSLTIYNQPGTNVLVMNIHTAGDLDLDKAIGSDSAYQKNPRCQEWEELMKTDFHHGWTELKEIHASDREWNKQLGASRVNAWSFAIAIARAAPSRHVVLHSFSFDCRSCVRVCVCECVCVLR